VKDFSKEREKIFLQIGEISYFKDQLQHLFSPSWGMFIQALYQLVFISALREVAKLEWGKGGVDEFMLLSPCSTHVQGLGAEHSSLGFGPLFQPWENFSFCIQRTKGFTHIMQDRAANALRFRHSPGSPELPQLHVSSG